MIEQQRDYSAEGEVSYRRWRDSLLADPEERRLYEEEAAKMDLWLQLVEARMAAGLTPRDVAERLGVSVAYVGRIEKRGYNTCSLSTLRRYVQALGDGFTLEVKVRQPEAERVEQATMAASHAG
jgi:hypothetical protein